MERKFQRDDELSAANRKEVYTHTKGLRTFLLIQALTSDIKQKAYRKTGKCWWYVKPDKVLSRPILMSPQPMTIEEACRWAEREFSPSRLQLLFKNYLHYPG